MRGRALAIAAAAAGAAALIAGCGSFDASHDYNAPTPVKTWRPAGGWVRIETPGNFPSAVFACHGTDGVYVAMDNSSSDFVVREDPNCR